MIIKILGKTIIFIEKIFFYIRRKTIVSFFKSAGKNIYIGRYCTFSYKNISLGNDIYIGRNCIFQSTHGKINIGNHVMFGPGVNIHGGNHDFKKKGYYIDENQKHDYNDGRIIIEDDCWIGANSIILKGVKIGKGSIIGAGSIVSKDVPSYSIIYNKMQRIQKERFSENELIKHENILKERKDKINE